jgi:RAD54-like protein 2
MVDFVRPNFLGTKTEFANMFERPIQNGQCVDSTPRDVRLMMHRAHVLHQQLQGFVQRRGHAVLRQSLPPKTEHVLLLRMTPIQRRLYRAFMSELLDGDSVSNPLKAFAVCCKIWNHPDVIFNYIRQRESAAADKDLDLDMGDEDSMAGGVGQTGTKAKGRKKKAAAKIDPLPATAPPSTNLFNLGQGFNPFGASPVENGTSKREEISYDWAGPLLEDYSPGQLENSSKFSVFFAILEETVLARDRLLLFSQSLFTLDLLEDYLQKSSIPGRVTYV